MPLTTSARSRHFTRISPYLITFISLFSKRLLIRDDYDYSGTA